MSHSHIFRFSHTETSRRRGYLCLWIPACFSLLFYSQMALAQESDWVPVLEGGAAAENPQELEEDIQQLQFYLVRPLDLNTAAEEDFSPFPFISTVQARQLISYRAHLGNFLDILELQAVPGWDIGTIRKMMPYVTVGHDGKLMSQLQKGWKEGNSFLLFRNTILRSGKSGRNDGNISILARYQFRSPVMQWGLCIEKDNGERFFQGRKGISFLSGNFMLRNQGVLKTLVLGDYLVNMGQGLVLWQGRGLSKSAMPMMIKRQQPLLQPYRSTDENRFFRGCGLVLERGRAEAGFFLSCNGMDGHLKSDTVTGKRYISSLQYSGLHRTPEELHDKNAMRVISLATSWRYHGRRWEAGVNTAAHFFSLPLISDIRPYNKFAFRGQFLQVTSLNYAYTVRNAHVFGELAADMNGHTSGLSGVMLAVDRRLDLSFLIRRYSRAYHSFMDNAFAESSEPVNEFGIYTGITARLSATVTLEGYADHYRFPWLKYRVSQPGRGMDNFIQCTWKPNKSGSFYIRYREEGKTADQAFGGTIDPTVTAVRQQWRIHAEWKLSTQTITRIRMEWIKVKFPGMPGERGFLTYAECFWKPPGSRIALNGCMMLFHSDTYNSRIYTYENDVMYYSRVPSFYGKGVNVYLNLRFFCLQRLQIFLKTAGMGTERGMVFSMRSQLIFSW